MTSVVGRARALLLAALLVLGAAGCEEEAVPPPERKLPPLGTFNAHVQHVLASYATDGTHGYHWPRSGAWIGTTRDLHYGGRLFAKGDPEGRCHCSGLTFEVFLRAWQRSCTSGERHACGLPGVPDVEGLRRFQREWFGASGDRATLHTAIVGNGLGVRVEDWETASAGDYVQLWRHSGSGHSCVFLSWVREEEEIVGLRYWSTQKSTNGIGTRTERFGTTGSAVKRDEFYLVRVGARPAAAER